MPKMSEFEWEWHADEAVRESKEYINTEEQILEKEHELIDRLSSWEYIVMHLDERIPESLGHLHKLNKRVSEKILELRDMVEADLLRYLRFEKEEKEIRESLDKFFSHRDWKAAKKQFAKEKMEKLKSLRLEMHELEMVRNKFSELISLIIEDSLIKAIDSDMLPTAQKDEFEKLEEYYFVQMYSFAVSYQKVLSDLIIKERKVSSM